MSSFLDDAGHTLGWYIQNYGSMENSRDIGGVVPAYPIFMLIGILAVIICTVIKMKMKNIPLRELEWAILIIVPLGVFGGSIFGKAFTSGVIWYHVFFFWEPGMSLFGAVGLGTIAGFIWFYERSQVTKISVWVYADCILPNVLIGQAIGRWGNMFNHEILGNTVSYESLSWLIPGIKNKLFYFPFDSFSGTNLPEGWGDQVQHLLQVHGLGYQITVGDLTITQDGNQIYKPTIDDIDKLNSILKNPGLIQFREPLFLYESIADGFFWIVLTFLIPNISRWCQPKGKYPWDIEPKAYPGWFNRKYKALPLEMIPSTTVQRPIKYKKVEMVLENGTVQQYRLGLYQAWNKAYYLFEPNQQDIDDLTIRQDKRLDNEIIIKDKLKSLEQKNKDSMFRLKENFNRKTNNMDKNHHRYIEWEKQLKVALENQKKSYKSDKKQLHHQLGKWTRFLKPNPDATELEKLNNPNNYFILRSGVLSGAYVLGYMIIRIVLETHRKISELFVQNSPIADYIVLAILLLIGLFIILLTQFVSPYKWRKVGWLYEKSY